MAQRIETTNHGGPAADQKQSRKAATHSSTNKRLYTSQIFQTMMSRNDHDHDHDDLDLETLAETVEEPSDHTLPSSTTEPGTTLPPPRHLRPTTGSHRTLSSAPTTSTSLASIKAGLRHPKATVPGAVPGAASVRQGLAATESKTQLSGDSNARQQQPGVVMAASAESYDDYLARKRRSNAVLVDIERSHNYTNHDNNNADNDNNADNADNEGEEDPYAHLRHQPSHPPPSRDSTLMPIAYEVGATPVFDDHDGEGDGKWKGRRVRNPLKDWRVLLFLAVALSAIVGLTVAFVMQSSDGDGGSNQQPTAIAPDPSGAEVGNVEDVGAGADIGIDVGPEDGAIPEEENDISDVATENVPNEEENDGGGSGGNIGDATTSVGPDDDGSNQSEESDSHNTDVDAAVDPPEIEITDRPTNAPTSSPTTGNKPIDSVTISPTPSPTNSPTADPTAQPTNAPTLEVIAFDYVPPYQMSPFVMSILSSSRLEDEYLAEQTVAHLYPLFQGAVPNIDTMSLSVNLSEPTIRSRYLRKEKERELQAQQFASYSATMTGTINFKDDTFVPTDDLIKDVLAEAFAGDNLQAFVNDRLSSAFVRIGGLAVKDDEGYSIAADLSSDVNDIYTSSAVSGSLQTTMTNRFTRDGVMLSITAKDFPVTITGLSIHTDSTGSNVPLEVWTKPGSYVGYEQDEAAWTPQRGGSPYILAQARGMGKLTPISSESFEAFTVPAGETVGVYITLLEGKTMLLGSSASINAVTENSLIKIESGSSVGYRFRQVNPNQVWGGSVSFKLAR